MKMNPRNISTKWAQIVLSIGFFGLLSQLSAAVVVPGGPGAAPGVPGGTPSLPPGGLPGGIGTLPPIPGATNTPPMIPGDGGIPGIPSPTIDPVTGVPIIGTPPGGLPPGVPPTSPPTGGGTTVSTNAPPEITPEMMREALRIFIRESKTIQRDARAGNPRQQHNLAILYTLGIGVPLDFKRAHHWFNKAALQGLPESQFNLAIAYQGGMGVRKDMVTAYKFYSLAATQGLPLASGGRDHIAQFMSRIQIETAQRMARGFQQGIARWQEMKDLEKAGQSNINRILGLKPKSNGSAEGNDGN